MRPGLTIIKKCSVCSELIQQHTIKSGNTFYGAILWTDGKRETPMFPDQHWLVMCPHCQAPLWIDELEEIVESEYGRDRHDVFKDAIAYETPSIDDYLFLLEKGAFSPDKERYVRLRLWWAGNDARRSSDKEIPLLSLEASNMTTFAEMLDELDANDLVMKAEVMRELGRFDDARALLDRSSDSSMTQAVEIIKSLVTNCDWHLREMQFK